MTHLRLTPSNSPFFKTSTPRSPTKSKSDEPGLRLKKVIGTTTGSANGFDHQPTSKQFAYTAGATAVVCTVEQDLNVTQRFFRARPTSGGGARELNGQWPISPTPADARSRVLGGIRDGANGSPLGPSARDWSDSPGGKSTTAKDRVKAATSVALSPNGKWVAMGETGYKPRVLIFANKGESSESPVSVLAEHTFGVHALAFSPDSKHLASLGTVNDGYIYVWAIDDRTGAASLHSSNKCTVLINRMIWVGQSLLTVGLRFVKCWRPTEDGAPDRREPELANIAGTPRSKATDFGNSVLGSRHKVLLGKNSLLGDMIDANFVAVVAVSEDRAIVCADSGEICLLSDCHNSQTFTATAHAGFRITAAAVGTSGCLSVAGPGAKTKDFKLEGLSSPSNVKANRRQTMSPNKSSYSDILAPIAVATIGDITVEMNSKRGIRLTRSSDAAENESDILSRQLAAHNEPVLGVQKFSSSALPSAAFFTSSSDGLIHIWADDGKHNTELLAPVESSSSMYDLTNELKAAVALPDGMHIATGDKHGTLSLLEVSSGMVAHQVRAHTAEIVDITAFERGGKQLLASASRDRTIQLFECCQNRLELLQTLEEHAAAVCGLLATKDGDLLLSCSTDRSVIVREAVNRMSDPSSTAYAMLRTISLKSSPTSMCMKTDTDEVLVATVDRNVGAYNLRNGQTGFAFKCSDTDGGEAAAMSKIMYVPSLSGNPTIVGVSSSDKSVRLYSEYGSLMARDWGHTEGITDVCLLDAKEGHGEEQPTHQQLVTVAADSTIFMWDTSAHTMKPTTQQAEVNGVHETPSTDRLSTPIGPPLRKVLSFTELSRFKRGRSVDDGVQTSPTVDRQIQPPPSPMRLKKKSSRITLAQPPKLEPPIRSTFPEHRRRSSLRKRSPSPPSPRSNAKKDMARKPSLGMTLRSKSSENVLTTASMGQTSGFGSLTSSTESVCRTLRAYRKKLANSSASDNLGPESLRELEKELRLTARAVGERSQGKNVDETTMARLLDQASEKIVSRLDERIQEKVEREVRRSTESSPLGASFTQAVIAEEGQSEHMDAVAGALEKVSLAET
ncbi:hypothetical protein LTR09_002829 [Extremus antarcticus]|uniref:WD40 repeat-like protein n=1 Tax=Extremus antarcticus TaxID=702011 RepID=A0AAJ0GF46_9PEZI|nr:hypothetical protein LTR09_002829 [Extremus antarcticus]